MSNHYTALQQLKQRRAAALALPRRVEQRKASLSDTKHELKWRLITFFSMVPTSLVLVYTLWLTQEPLYPMHATLQTGLFLLATGIAATFYGHLLRLQAFEAFYWWVFKSTPLEKFATSLSVYGIFYLLAKILLHQWIVWMQGSPWQLAWLKHVNPEMMTYRFETSLNFYTAWLGYAIFTTTVIGILEQVGKRYVKTTSVKTIKHGFRLWLGRSTGWLAQLSHGAGLAAGQQVALSLEDATQNTVILGGTGSGKTTRAISPLLMQCLDQGCGGIIFNIKGDFHHTVENFVAATYRWEQLTIIGEKATGLNLIEGLTPEMAATFLKSCLLLGGHQRLDSFWVDTATELCRNALGVLSFLPEHYHLAGLRDYLFDEQEKNRIHQALDAQPAPLDPAQNRLLQAYRSYEAQIFKARFDEKVQGGVLASVAQLLAPFSHPELVDLFCRNSSFKMESVLEGQIVLVNLPLARWGLGGKIADNFIKLRFFNVMQQRALHPEWNQDKPVFFLCDEYQEIVSGNKDGLSDLNFWDKSRSSKTIGIISAQSISSFYAAIGDRDIANALLQNFRQKLCFRTEDQTTLDYLNRLTGHVEVEKRSTSKQHGSSSSHSGKGGGSSRSRTETVSWVDKPVLDPQLMRNLRPEQAIAILVLQGHSCDDVLDLEIPIYT